MAKEGHCWLRSVQAPSRVKSSIHNHVSGNGENHAEAQCGPNSENFSVSEGSRIRFSLQYVGSIPTRPTDKIRGPARKSSGPCSLRGRQKTCGRVAPNAAPRRTSHEPSRSSRKRNWRPPSSQMARRCSPHRRPVTRVLRSRAARSRECPTCRGRGRRTI